jgi:chorismate dehydratase
VATPLRIAAVSYLNTKPFLWGLEQTLGAEQLSIQTDVPSKCLGYFIRQEVDVALVPVGALLGLPEAHVLDGYCIGANRHVDSVFIFAQQPITELDALYLDPHSQTSNGLARVLCQHYWQRPTLRFVEAQGDHIAHIQGRQGGVVIGDKAFPLIGQFAYTYDLANAWHQFTGHEHPATGGWPFTFAVWVVQPSVSAATRRVLREAFQHGLAHREAVAQLWANRFGLTPAQAYAYYTQSIDYALDAAKKQSIDLYLTLLSELDGQHKPVLHWV